MRGNADDGRADWKNDSVLGTSLSIMTTLRNDAMQAIFVTREKLRRARSGNYDIAIIFSKDGHQAASAAVGGGSWRQLVVFWYFRMRFVIQRPFIQECCAFVIFVSASNLFRLTNDVCGMLSHPSYGMGRTEQYCNA
jgi:hypothetical protein